MKAQLVIHSGIHVKNSDTHGWGVFTSSDISKGDIVEECVIPIDIIPLDNPALINYRFIWSSRKPGATIEGYCLALGFGSIYNHSEEDPNVDWDIDVELRILRFVAIRDIRANEELFHDYMHDPTLL